MTAITGKYKTHLTINRRSRLYACVTYSHGPANHDVCKLMSPRQIIMQYKDLRGMNSYAAIFVTLWWGGKRWAFTFWAMSSLVEQDEAGYFDGEAILDLAPEWGDIVA